MIAAEEILAGLSKGSRTLVFVDETGTPGKPLPSLAADFRLYCAVLVPSDAYPAIKQALRSYLRNLDPELTEFHATEIVNPSSKSKWKGISCEKRLESIRFLGDRLIERAQLALYTYVSGEQFNAELLPKILALGGRKMDHETALEDVFFKALFEFMRHLGGDIAVVIDSPVALPGKIKIQDVRDPANVYQGGVIFVESWVEEGLQLADLAAYILNRVFHTKQRRADGKANAFDDLVDDIYTRLRSNLVDLLVASQVLGLRQKAT